MKRQLTKIFRVVGVVILSAYLCDSLQSQVRIREKVSIDPKPVSAPPSVQSGDVSLVVKFTYSGTYRSDRAHFLRVTNCAVDQFFDPMSNSATLSVPARSGANKATIRFSTPEGGGSGTWHYSFEIDGTVIRQDENSVNCFCTIILLPEVFLQSGMRFTLPSSITHGESAAITMTSQPFTLCSKTVWHPLMKTTISITEGQELGNFYDENGVNLGTSVTGNQSELAKIRFVADGEQPEGGKGTLKLASSSQGVTVGEGEVEIEATSTPPVIDSVRTVAGKLKFPVGTTVGLIGYFHDVDDDVTSAGWTKIAGPPPVVTSTNGSIPPQLSSAASGGISSPVSSFFTLNEQGFHVFQFTVHDEGNSTRTKNLTVEAIGIDHFDIVLEKDEIAFTETSKIFVQAKDKENNDAELDGDAKITFLLLGESAYGTFIKPNGDTVKMVPVELANISYSEARTGKVVFAAVAANPETVGKPKIVIFLKDDPSIDGEKNITVLEQHLRIVMDPPLEVQPRLHRAGILQLSAANRKTFGLGLTRGGVLVGQHPFNMTTDYIAQTGGHDHLNIRTESRENYGYFIPRQSDGQEGRPINGETSASFLLAFDYVSTIFGDSIKITLQSRRYPDLLKDSVILIERIPSLIGLQDGQNYVKIGGTQLHYGPPTHVTDHNHFGTSSLIQHVQAIADSFATSYSHYHLRINDMSLPFGGAFDIYGRWSQDVDPTNCLQAGFGHCTHRIGENADISFLVLDGENNETPLTFRQRLRLLEIITSISGQPVTHSDHFHIN